METALANLTATIEKLVTRMDALEKRIASGVPAAPAGGAGAAASSGEMSPAEEKFEELVSEKLMPLIEQGKKISPIVEKELADFVEAHKILQKLIGAASRSKKPADIAATVQEVAAPLFKKIGEVAEYKDKNFRAKEIEVIASISEAASALSWVVIAPKPVPYLNDVIPSAEFHFNRVMRDTKDSADRKWQWQWAKDFVAYLRAHQEYVKNVHTTGLLFSGAGDLKAEFGSAPAASAAAAAPAPPAAPSAPAAAAAPSKPAPDMGALFGALNKGTAITSGLKHVTADQKTKNRPASERTSLVPGNVEKKPAAAPKAGTAAKKVKPPSKTHAGNKWIIENYTEGQIVVDDTRLNDMVYIGNCRNCTITVKGKINGVTVDSCEKVGVVVDDIVSVFEIVNSNSVQCQIVGKAPCVNIDKCTGAQLYLSAAAVTGADPTKVYTSKTSSINILIPGKTEDDDMVELAVPEQFCSVVVNGKLNTEMSSMQGM